MTAAAQAFQLFRIANGRSAPRELFFAVLFVVGLHSLFRVTPRMNHVRPRYVGVVRRLLVLSAFVVLCCFTMVTRNVGKMFLYLLVVFGSFFDIVVFSRAWLFAMLNERTIWRMKRYRTISDY